MFAWVKANAVRLSPLTTPPNKGGRWMGVSREIKYILSLTKITLP
jgi:hypothetical protein